jgi:5-methylcytosine-specific restriction protein A
MPHRARRACIHPACPDPATAGSYCAAHRDRSHDRRRRHDPHVLFLKSTRWRRFRAWFLQDHPVCATCGRVATEVDHILRRRHRPDLALVPSNCQALCRSCHARKTAGERAASSQ